MKKFFLTVLILALAPITQSQVAVPPHPYIKFETTEGDIVVELDGRRAPITVANFLKLVDEGYYDGTVFHRVIKDFMIQGGGYTPGLQLRETGDFIVNESGNGLSNVRGTIAMARLESPHTAGAQFFINLEDNKALDPQRDRWGYAVFGNVVEGMDVVKTIGEVRTGPQGQFSSDVPNVPIVIKKAFRFNFE
ncbi:MAG: peptidylprolyl isomerase [Proteobacteria bacterium]|nr:peptidylprolyl isomerase [Pseudomonadota bacterium]MDA0993943.1 peptidylprolyl isomerase [Pseudomonadota bacterium]